MIAIIIKNALRIAFNKSSFFQIRPSKKNKIAETIRYMFMVYVFIDDTKVIKRNETCKFYVFFLLDQYPLP